MDAKYIEEEYVGSYLTKGFLSKHTSIDACGENGEYHSLVVSGPIFAKPLQLICGDTYEQEFVFNVRDEKGGQKIIRDTIYFADFELKSNN